MIPSGPEKVGERKRGRETDPWRDVVVVEEQGRFVDPRAITNWKESKR